MGEMTESKTITSLKSQLLAIRALVDEALASCEVDASTVCHRMRAMATRRLRRTRLVCIRTPNSR